jgi:catechol 2,3-dioxygenase-like lactoylglutathione lyase family enzyme
MSSDEMRIDDLFHVNHVVEDFETATSWYDRVLTPVYMYERHESDVDHRTAAMTLVADVPIELMAPHPGPIGRDGNIGVFLHRFGPGFHGLAFYSDTIPQAFERWRSAGIRVAGDGGGAIDAPPARGSILTHPRQTYGLVQLMTPRVGGKGGTDVGGGLGDCYDPRLLGAHDALAWLDHPLGIVRGSHITVLVDDLDLASQVYTDVFAATPLTEPAPGTGAVNSLLTFVGTNTIIELARPRAGSEEQASLERDGGKVWAVTFEVLDLERARHHLTAVECAPVQLDDVTIAIPPERALGARYRFRAGPLTGDPRPAPDTATASAG